MWKKIYHNGAIVGYERAEEKRKKTQADEDMIFNDIHTSYFRPKDQLKLKPAKPNPLLIIADPHGKQLGYGFGG